MSNLSRSKIRLKRHASPDMVRRSQPERRRSLVVLVLLLLVWSICLGMGMAQATDPRTVEGFNASEAIAQATPSNPSSTPTQESAVQETAIGTVDAVPPRLQFGQKLYLDNCATCHIGIPPAVMPTQTWQQLIQDPEHYGVAIQPLRSPEIQVLWQYLREYSRPLAQGESTPYRIQQSRLFKALHPRVKFTEPANLNGCISCHPGAGAYDFRRLTAEWQNAP
ncbi:MAG: diheme cytochrome C [Leptolyngbyaceae cyanobacterium bins.302]|nr:diheme cytochrome C [Leptolyngbyaceae cyanobacterium bins.302]